MEEDRAVEIDRRCASMGMATWAWIQIVYIPWLVVWNIFYLSIYWECHHPN